MSLLIKDAAGVDRTLRTVEDGGEHDQVLALLAPVKIADVTLAWANSDPVGRTKYVDLALPHARHAGRRTLVVVRNPSVVTSLMFQQQIEYTDPLDSAALHAPVSTPQGVAETAVLPSVGKACTATATTDIVTCTNHGFADGDQARFSGLTGGAGLTAGAVYYVRDSASNANELKVAATPGGTAINITSNMTAGTVVKTNAQAFFVDPPLLSAGGRLLFYNATALGGSDAFTGSVQAWAVGAI